MHKLIEKECLECGQTFRARNYEVNHGRGKFCSGSCRSIYYGRIRRKLVSFVCQYCGIIIELRPSRAKHRKYCSPDCSSKAKINKDKVPNRELQRESGRRAREKRVSIIIDVFGPSCFFCSNEVVRIIHRKDGRKHKLLSSMGLGELRRLIETEKDEYVRLCGICHKGVHWCMRWLGLNWDEIIERFISENT